MSRSARFLLFASLGPITGPLAAGLARCIRQGRPVMAGVYGVAIVETWAVLAALGAHFGSVLGIRLG